MIDSIKKASGLEKWQEFLDATGNYIYGSEAGRSRYEAALRGVLNEPLPPGAAEAGWDKGCILTKLIDYVKEHGNALKQE